MDVALHLVLMIVPIACFVLALRWTRNLRSADPAVLPFGGLTIRTPAALLLGAAAFAAYILGLILSSPGAYGVMLGLMILSVAATIAAHARQNLAARGIIGPVLGGALAVPLLFGFLTVDGTVANTVALSWLACTALALWLWLTWQGGASVPARLTHPATRCFLGVFLVLGLVGAINRTTYSSPHRLQTVVEEFDESVDEMTQWDDVGRIAEWLQSRGAELDLAVPRTIIREAIARGVDVHPKTLKGAIRAGLLGPEEFRHLLAAMGDYGRRSPLKDRATGYSWGSGDWVDLVVLLEVGDLTQAERAQIATNLSRSWPEVPGIGNLEDAASICRVLARLERTDLILAHRPALHDLLKRSWCDTAAWFSRPGGFSVYDMPEKENRSTDDASNVDALDLMQYAGAPAWFEAGRLKRNARGGLRPSLLLHGFALSRFDLLDLLTVNRTSLEHDATPSAAMRLRDWSLWVAMVLSLLFVVIVVRRAPLVPVHEMTWKEHTSTIAARLEETVPELRRRKRAGLSPYDKPPAG